LIWGEHIVRIEDEKPGLALLVKKICAESDLTPEVGKQVAHVQLLVDADIGAIVQLLGVQIPALDKPLGQHQGWPGEFYVWNWQTLALDHRVASIARRSSARQAFRSFASNSKHGYNV